ncbi:MAG: hypothetical protein LBI92_06750 [Azoarcus sp.]|jgi:hypothetical protein|nr:hypothetical protein [Azoarcus sp.]
MSIVANIKARRITGGAVVTVTRLDGRRHRYRVGLRRYNRLRDMLNVHLGTYGGYFSKNGFDVDLREAQGFADARRWIACCRFDARRRRHWMAAA